MGPRRYILSLLFLSAGLCPADVLVTADGQTLDGDLRKTPAGWSVTLADGSVVDVDAAKVASIELSTSSTKPSRAIDALQSLRRSVQFSADLPRIIDRYKRFIAQTSDVSIVAAARQDLKVWEDRKAAGAVRVGKQWVSPAEAEQLAADSRRAVLAARALMKAGQFGEARQAVNGLLEADPDNISATYLSGVLFYREANPAEARKAFAQLQQSVPTHTPSAFNLAVASARLKQWASAVTAMERAITLTPNNQQLLDATAELLHMLPPERQNVTATQKLTKIFLDQDAVLQREMAKQKLYRWGTSWVDQLQHDQIQQTAADITKNIADLQRDFETTEARVISIDRQMADNTTSLRTIEQHSYMRMPDGTTVRTSYPPSYYEIQSRNTQLSADRSNLTSHLDALRLTARDTKAKLPVAPYTGTLAIIEEDGVPLVGPVEDIAPPDRPPDHPAEPPPATQPAAATQPANIIRIGPANTE